MVPPVVITVRCCIGWILRAATGPSIIVKPGSQCTFTQPAGWLACPSAPIARRPGFRGCSARRGLRGAETHGIIRCLLGRQAARGRPTNRESRMLSTFIAAAAAPAAAPQSNPIYSFGFLILLFVVFYF